jgi:starch phosphorylase
MPQPEPSRSKRTGGRPTAGPRVAHDAEAIQRSIHDNLFYQLARFPPVASKNDYYLALAYAVRDRLLHRWVETVMRYREERARTVCYLSAEFLLGPHLGNNLLALGIEEATRQACLAIGLDLDELLAQEEEPGLGNGGLGRLAACYLDSLATLEVPAIGYGIRYEFGIFDQTIKDGWQVEISDTWLRLGNPWEIARPEIAFTIGFGGRTESYVNDAGTYRVRWTPEQEVRGVAYDTPIAGYGVETTNFLRLWRAEARESFDFQAFNHGDYLGAVEEKVVSENLTKVLYPNDAFAQGKELRLRQQYFFVACALRDMIRIHLQRESDLGRFHEKYAVQLNDTHPALAVAELQRLLVDEYLLEWDAAWEITQATMGYTNHTLLPEALETWSVELFGRLLPRHLEIIYEINRRFLEEVGRRFPGDGALAARVSLIGEGETKTVRMAHLATVGSHCTNGVSKLHSKLLIESVLADFYRLWPERFTNVTNGVTPRRFLMLVNPGLRALLLATIGDAWTRDLERLRDLEPHAGDAAFRAAFREVKLANKRALASQLNETAGIVADPESLFDVQAKRIHEYKRQHLNALHAIHLYLSLVEDGREIAPRTVIFAGKAAPGYFLARRIIKLVHSIGDTIHRDPAVEGRLRVIFSPDFNVKNAQRIYPGADLSEQISTAGKEASGTGNMKFAMNGALTIGTLDGANVEIREQVGTENFFLFGLTAPAVAARKAAGYDPRDVVASDPRLARVLDALGSGRFSGGDRELFQPILDALLDRDEYLVLADFAAYVDAQEEVGRLWADPDEWSRRAILNVARMGYFSSDRAIREYGRDIWKVGKA